jgi:hypothetical protein
MNEILKIPFAVFDNDWDDLQLFLKHRGNPPYEITDDLNLSFSKIESLGNLTSVGGTLDLYESKIESLGNLTSVEGDLDLRRTILSKIYIKEEIRKMVKVEGNVYF